jgi:hypothetical protein
MRVLVWAGVLVLLIYAGRANAAVVKKANDTAVTGPLVALENDAVVLNVTTGAKSQRVSTPLADVVEITFDKSVDATPATRPSAATTHVATKPKNAKEPKIFDGATLDGWEGDSDVWSVRDAAIVGKVEEKTKGNRVVYLAYTKQRFSDFELTYSFKITGGQRNSSGMQFRSNVQVQDGAKDVVGYQQDLGEPAGSAGGIVDSGGNANGQQLKAEVGERAMYDANGARSAVALGMPSAQLNALYRPGEWNVATLVVRGNHLVSMINGQIFAEAINDSPNAAKDGLLAIQISRRQIMTVEMKDFSLRRLSANELPKTPGVAWDKLLDKREIVLSTATAPTAPTAAGPASRPARAWQAKLVNGDQITGEMLEWDDKLFKLKTEHGDIAIPVKQLAAVWHAPSEDVAKALAAAGTSGAGATEDVAFARKDDQVIPVAGLVLGSDGKSLKFRFREQERAIGLDKFVGATLAVSESSAPDDSLQQAFVFAGTGDVISGKWAALEPGGMVTLATAGGTSLKFSLASVDSMRTKNGRLTYLSDLTPAQVEQTPYFDRMLAYRLDKSLTGTPIKLTDGDHSRGVSVHSRTILRYDIARRYERFKAKVGFQQPEGKAGRAVVRVLGDDGKVLHEIADARGDQPPVDLNLSVAGVSRLTLEVDFGADQDVGDRVAWADARLIRAATK